MSVEQGGEVMDFCVKVLLRWWWGLDDGSWL